jgi:14-3-3 protein epsilon
MNTENYSREEYIYLAKLYERAEKYQEMVNFIIKYVEMNPVLVYEEKEILSSGFKNLISSKRSSWRTLKTMEKKEEKKKSPNLACLKEVRANVEAEIKLIFEDINRLLENFLIPTADENDDREGLVFYLKLSGDYNRYLAEFAVESELEKVIVEAETAYQKAYEIAESELPITNTLRLGLSLNFSLFCYEIANQKEEACEIAKSAFEESMKVLDELERNKAKDTIIIIQILKENLILWNNEISDD